jgi:hypothetical protein
VLGGTDGNLLSQDLFHISFKDDVVKVLPSEMENFTGMGHLILRQQAGKQQPSLHHIGGVNSSGKNYVKQVNESKWKDDKW